MEKWIRVWVYGVQPTGTVDMRDRGNQRPLVLAHLEHGCHKGHIGVLFKPFAHVGPQDGWGEWPKRFTALDLEIQDFPHVDTAWITQD